jgi:hypothetical protein
MIYGFFYIFADVYYFKDYITMKYLKNILLITVLFSLLSINAQDKATDRSKNLVIISEVGIVLGPTFIQSDYGENDDFSSDTANSGIGFGAMYVADFSASRYKSKFLSFMTDHMKTRVELSFTKVNLEHTGAVIEEGAQADRFRAMKGETKIFNIGVYGDFHFLSLTKSKSNFQPYFSSGLVYSSVSPDVVSPQDQSLLPTAFQNLGDDLDTQSVISFAYGLGTRYKLKDVDILVESRFQAFLSDKIDGIDTEIPGDKNEDSLVLFNVGVVFHLN